MKNYVLGFYFYPDPPCKVVLILKKKPSWQKGFWNGVGGSVEKGEAPLQAMRREFQEETGAIVSDWRLFSLLTGPGYCVSCYSAMGQEDVRTTTDEIVRTFIVYQLPDTILPNLAYLIPMAFDTTLKSVMIAYYENT